MISLKLCLFVKILSRCPFGFLRRWLLSNLEQIPSLWLPMSLQEGSLLSSFVPFAAGAKKDNQSNKHGDNHYHPYGPYASTIRFLSLGELGTSWNLITSDHRIKAGHSKCVAGGEL